LFLVSTSKGRRGGATRTRPAPANAAECDQLAGWRLGTRALSQALIRMTTTNELLSVTIFSIAPAVAVCGLFAYAFLAPLSPADRVALAFEDIYLHEPIAR
jgi:hypothetical protein